MKILLALLWLVLVPVSCASAATMGRIFFTPEQREQLEYKHAHSPDSEPDATPRIIMLNGIVQQHGGTRTIWINGVAQNSLKGGELAAEPVAVPGKKQHIKINVGQKLLLEK